MLRLKAMLIGFAAGVIPAVGFAAPPPATFTLYDIAYTSGSYSGPDFTASLTTQPSLSIVATASRDILSLYEEQYIGSIVVWGEVTGPSSSTIPIDVDYFESDSTIITPGGYADAGSKFVFDDGVNTPVAVGEITARGYSSSSMSDGGTYSLAVQTNIPFSVSLDATDTLYAPYYAYGVGESASSYLDPMIYIDPSFANSHPGYSLAISAGIQNVGPSSAPEPATWA